MRRRRSAPLGSVTMVIACDDLPFPVTQTENPDLVSQVQESIRRAADFGTPFVLYTESDKALFFELGLRDFVQRAPAEVEVGIVLAARSPESFETYPVMQRYTESVINHLCSEVIGVGGDYSYGPFLINHVLLPHLTHLHPRLGWGWRHSMFRAAHLAGLRVVHVVGDYPCPAEMSVEDANERTHRMRQLSQNILGLTA
jgi:hypothetical protein